MDSLDRLLEHDAWATNQVLDLCHGLRDEQLDREFDIGHRTIRATLAHMIPNYAFWTALMTGQPTVEWSGPNTLDALSAEHERGYAAFAAIARQMRDAGRLEETFQDHHGYPFTFGGTILMVILHHEAHRADIIHIFARLGVPELANVELDHGLWDFKRRGVF